MKLTRALIHYHDVFSQVRGFPAGAMVPPPRHVDPSLLKQHSPPQPAALHQPKPYMDNFISLNTPDLHKEQHTLNSFTNFPLGVWSCADKQPDFKRIAMGMPVMHYISHMSRPSLFVLLIGLASNLNVNNPDLGSVGFKEPQSRLKKWTAMDVSINSPLDQNPSKPGQLKHSALIVIYLFVTESVIEDSAYRHVQMENAQFICIAFLPQFTMYC